MKFNSRAPSSTTRSTWDYANRLTGATVDGMSVTYTYDGDGVRVAKTVGMLTTAERPGIGA
jgi:YD repeat-containing protein